jgi:hypothetical protein
MTAKEKAKELFDKFCYAIRTEERTDGYYTNIIHAKQCALIAVDELIKEELLWLQEVGGNESESEWIKVKQEINNL